MYNDPKQQLRKLFSPSGIPATITLIALNVVTWLVNVTMGMASPALHLVFDPATWPLPELWSILTWPLVAGGHPLFFLLALLWAYWIAGSLERAWGTGRFVLVFFALTALTAGTTWIGTRLVGDTSFGRPVTLAGLWTAMAAPTVAWCVLNSRERVGMYFGLIQVPALWLAGLVAVMLWYEVGPPLLGLFALSGCAAAWWYASRGGESPGRMEERNRIHTAAKRFKPAEPERIERGGGFNPLRAWKERQERKRLEDMFRRSGFTDDDR